MKKFLVIIGFLFLVTGSLVFAMDGIENGKMNTSDAITVNAAYIYPYIKNSIYIIYTRPDRLVDIQFQIGEEISNIGGADTVRWIIDKQFSGTGSFKQWHIYIKPIKDDPTLSTSLYINTDLHSYYVEAYVSLPKFTPIVSWTYPQEESLALMKSSQEETDKEENNIPVDISLEKVNFDYIICSEKSDSRPTFSWTPLMVFDDGKKTYIKMPEEMLVKEAPALFVKDGETLVLENYRVKKVYYIIDRLIDEAELRCGKDIVRILRKGYKPPESTHTVNSNDTPSPHGH